MGLEVLLSDNYVLVYMICSFFDMKLFGFLNSFVLVKIVGVGIYCGYFVPDFLLLLNLVHVRFFLPLVSK